MRRNKRNPARKTTILLGCILLSVSALSGYAKTSTGNGSENTTEPIGADFRESEIQSTADIGSGHSWDGETTTGSEAYFDNTTTVVLDGSAFDIQERNDMVNAIQGIQAAGTYWIVEGHISPYNGYYGFYNTETSQWEKEIIGSLLTWYGANEEDTEIPFSMDTVVYAFWNELYDGNGNLLQKIELDESESETIYKLNRTSTGVEVYIYNGSMEERVVEVEAPISTL